jgi:hypothetical protein
VILTGPDLALDTAIRGYSREKRIEKSICVQSGAFSKTPVRLESEVRAGWRVELKPAVLTSVVRIKVVG